VESHLHGLFESKSLNIKQQFFFKSHLNWLCRQWVEMSKFVWKSPKDWILWF
jgi:hypothetical protein